MAKIKRESRKRRAPSPAPSDESGSERRVYREIESKRRKKEISERLANGNSTSGSRRDANDFVLPTSTTTEQGITTPPHESTLMTTSQRNHQSSAGLAPTLRNSGRDTDGQIHDAIAAEAIRQGVVLDIDTIHLVLADLRGDGYPENAVREIERSLRATWRQRMARSIAQMITNADELRATLDAICTAVTFQLGPRNFVFRPTRSIGAATSDFAEARYGTASIRPRRNSDSYRVSKSRSLPISRSAEQRSDAVDSDEEEPEVESAGKRIKRERISDTELPALREYMGFSVPMTKANASNSREDCESDNDTIETLTQLYPHAFDIFFYHFESCSRNGLSGRPHQPPVDAAAVREDAEMVYNSLDLAQKKEWGIYSRRLHDGDITGLDPDVGRELLLRQRLKATTPGVPDTRKTHTPELGVLPIFIPFAGKRKKQANTECKVQFLVNTPDTPSLHKSEDQMHTDLSLAFGAESLFCGVEKWNDYVWTATFRSEDKAKKWKDQTITMDGKIYATEHVYSAPASVFISDFSNVDVGQEEVAAQIARAFHGTRVRPQLSVQESKKLYAGKQYVIRFARLGRRVGEWMRFYIAMRKQNESGLHLACFKPMNMAASCMLCGYPHAHGLKPCQSAKSVELPSMS